MDATAFLAALSIALPLPVGPITIENGQACDSWWEPGTTSCVLYVSPRTIHLQDPHWRNRRLVAHELGHVFDLSDPRWGDRDRQHWARLAVHEWDEEVFADTYSACALGYRWLGGDWSHYPAYLGQRQLRKVCVFLRRVLRRPYYIPAIPAVLTPRIESEV